MTLRVPETQEAYDRLRASGALSDRCVLCEKEPVQAFQHWKIITNDFPYDRIARVHHMLVPYRHVTERGLSETERRELLDIKRDYINKSAYNWLMEAAKGHKTIPDHFHLHILAEREAFSA